MASGRCMAGGTLPGTGWKGWKESCAHQAGVINTTHARLDVRGWAGGGVDVCVLLPFLPFNLVDRLDSAPSAACQGQRGQLSRLGLVASTCLPGIWRSGLL